ncbi:hypothetical protein OROMI_019463 [Orobanche minor]
MAEKEHGEEDNNGDQSQLLRSLIKSFMECNDCWPETHMSYSWNKLIGKPGLFMKSHQNSSRKEYPLLTAVSLYHPRAARALEDGEDFVNPWSLTTLKNLLHRMNSQVVKYEGYHLSKRAYPGKVALSSLLKSANNKCIHIGWICTGVYSLFEQHPHDVVALKRKSFGFAHRLYLYSDYYSEYSDGKEEDKNTCQQ